MSDTMGADGPSDATAATDPAATNSSPMSKAKVTVLGLYLAVSFLIQIAFLIGFWPEAKAPEAVKDRWECYLYADGCHISAEGRLIVLVLISGGIGAMVHAIRSFSGHLGAGKLSNGWGWWYLLRPLEGAVLALGFYLVLGGGLVQMASSASSETASASVYGVAGLSVLVGMFSQEAVTKLKAVAETLFSKATVGVTNAAGETPLPKPSVTRIDPSVVKQGTQPVKVSILGTGFAPVSRGRVDGTDRPTYFKSATELAMDLLQDDTKTSKGLKITVANPGPGGGESTEEATLRITA